MSQENAESMRIGYLFDGYLRPNEGVPAYIEDVASYMERHGHEAVRIVGGSDREQSDVVVKMGKTASFGVNGNTVEQALPISARRAERVLDITHPDILHLQMPHNPLVSGRIAKRAADVPIVATFHVLPNSPAMSVGMRVLAKATRGLSESLGTMISNSKATQQFVKDVYGLDSELIPNPVDVRKFQRGKKLAEYDDEMTNVVFLGRLVERKGVQHLVNAVGSLSKKTRAGIRLLIAGTGELSTSLQEQVELLGLSDNTTFLGYIEDEQKPDLLATADLAVFPATGGESFGIVLAEAMAARAGVVLGGDNPGYRSVLGDTPEAIIEPRNTAKFAAALNWFIQNTEERQRVHEVQQRAVQQFDIGVVGAAIEKIYKDAVS